MSSFVYYKFKSQKDESRVSFDGTGISIFDLKREIILAKGFEKAIDFDIVLLDPNTDEEYDDSYILPRSSTVVVKRTPVRAGKSKIPRYLSGSAPASRPVHATRSAPAPLAYSGNMSKRFDGREPEKPKEETKPILPSTIEADEAAAMEAMFAAESQNWNETQEKMAQGQRVYSTNRYGPRKPGGPPGGPGGSGAGSSMPPRDTRFHPYSDRPIPQGYVCFRCGQKGHWIQDCPTNKDKEFDNKPRIKRTTGIPRSFLKTIEKTDDGPVGPGVMITPEGQLVMATPDTAAWEKQVGKGGRLLTEADIRERAVSDSSLVCSLDGKLFRNPVKTPCCSTTYCEECIQSHLVDNDFVCPSCKSPIRSLDKLNMDKPTRTRVMDYIDKALAAANAEIEAAELSKASSSTPRVSQQITHPQTPEPARSKSQEPNTKQPEDDKKPEHSENLQASLYEAPPQSQPGYQESQTLEQIQAEIHQLQTMIQTAKLPPHARNQAMMKLTQKQTLLNQAQTMQMLLSQAQSMAAAEAAMYQNYNAMQQGGYGGYPGQAGYGNNMGSGWNQQQQQQRSSAVPPPSNDSDSPYQRLPVNPRRKVVKRERPSDFVEVSGRGHYDS